jgi:transposase-like protein
MKTLQDAFAFFSVPQNCIDYAIKMRWPDGVVTCPHCGSTAVKWLPTRNVFQCSTRHKGFQFSVKVGTIMEDSPIALNKWLIIMWMLGTCRNGISSYEVARTIGITQKSAWFMLHRLRECMKMTTITLSGEVEADETFIGGKPKNKHQSARKQDDKKTPVFGMVERGGFVVAGVVPKASEKDILPMIASTIQDKSQVYTDASGIYDKVRWMGKSLKHGVINHQQDAYKSGKISTNSIENFWSTLKRMLAGTYISVRPFHLNAYVIEQAFRYNHRFKFVTEESRLQNLLMGTVGRRLTYKELVAR